MCKKYTCKLPGLYIMVIDLYSIFVIAIDTEFQAKYEKKATTGRHGCKTKVLFTYILRDFRGVPTLI